jgi:probable rRNA maturation factor
MIELTLRNTTRKKYSTGFFEKIAAKACANAKLNRDIGLSINLVGNARIRELNREHRGKDKATDVLSFPLQETVRTSKNKGEQGILELGDIFICMPVAEAEATAEKVSLNDKLAFLTVHGFLHLLGYDHERSSGEASAMFKLQDRIIASL